MKDHINQKDVSTRPELPGNSNSHLHLILEARSALELLAGKR